MIVVVSCGNECRRDSDCGGQCIVVVLEMVHTLVTEINTSRSS